MEVVFVVKVLENNDLIVAYTSQPYIGLPFVPTVGMKFKQGISTWLWETENGELAPPVKEVIYDLDDEIIYCLFEINQLLKSSFWKPIKNISNSHELRQFETH